MERYSSSGVMSCFIAHHAMLRHAMLCDGSCRVVYCVMCHMSCVMCHVVGRVCHVVGRVFISQTPVWPGAHLAAMWGWTLEADV